MKAEFTTTAVMLKGVSASDRKRILSELHGVASSFNKQMADLGLWIGMDVEVTEERKIRFKVGIMAPRTVIRSWQLATMRYHREVTKMRREKDVSDT